VTSAPCVNELVLGQLSFQLPQNSGARGKGNWPLGTGQLQSLAGYLISWHCNMTSKRASKSKSKSSARKERAKASGSEIHSSHGKGHAKAREGETCRLRSRPSRHRKKHPFPSPQAGANPHLPKLASRGTFPSMLKPKELARNIWLS
jgi:hypothetical protein